MNMKRKVLFIAHSYPPLNSMGALRAAKFAKYLPRYGWEPIVVTRTWPKEMWGLEEPPGIRVIRTGFHDRLGIFRRGRSAETKRAAKSPWHSCWKTKLRKLASFWVREFLAYPDEFIAWKPYALKAARKLLKEERISLIFSTSPPPTSHLIAHELQQVTGIPWVADLRDLWTQNHYLHHTRLRKWIEIKLEKKILQNASMLITVSEPFAEKLRQLHGKPVEVITNGFDEEDFADPPPPLTPYFSITYTGQVYSGKRDPSLLFAAIRELLKDNRINSETFKIRFYGPERDREFVLQLADRYEVSELVVHHGKISYREAIRRQRESTVLLLLSWQSAEEKGVYTGKVFEYLGAQRPILAIPKIGGVVDELLEETGAGVSAGTKEEVIQIVRSWYDEFTKFGSVSYKGTDQTRKKYTRAAQAKKLAEIFKQIV